MFESIFLKPKLPEEERQMLERVNPMLMGGEYLSDSDIEEVEIARLAIASTPHDVTCVYASFK